MQSPLLRTAWLFPSEAVASLRHGSQVSFSVPRFVERLTGSASPRGSCSPWPASACSGHPCSARALGRPTWPIAVYAILSLAVLRGFAVNLAMIGSRLHPTTVAFMGWFGPRGLASIISAGLVVQDAVLDSSDLIVALTMVTVGLSIYAHGAASWRGSESYGRWYAGQQNGQQSQDPPPREHRADEN